MYIFVTMAKHVLSLEIPDVSNKNILRVVDTSVYAPNIDIVCPLLQITPPGFVHPSNIEPPVIEPGFILNATACDLQLQTTDCNDTFYDIQDGIYIIKYSIEPKEYVYVEYNHLRITCAMNKVNQVYCNLELGDCDPPADKKAILNQIRLIEQYLKAAKAYVEDCHDAKKGMELYSYAVKLLDKLTCNDCKTC